jgi:hypothetical protein
MPGSGFGLLAWRRPARRSQAEVSQGLVDRLLHGEDRRHYHVAEPSQALTHTHGMSGSPQLLLARTPPQGPLRNCLGTIGRHAGGRRTHCLHMRQSNMKPFTFFDEFH